MPTYLIDADTVFEATGQNPDLMELARGAVDSAIARATIKLEDVLSTSFDPRTAIDLFYVTEDQGAPLSGFYRFLLSAGFVREDHPFVVETSYAMEGPYTQATAHTINKERGFLQVWAYDLLWKYVRVSYAFGFKDPAEAPDPLKQALICYVPLLMLNSASVAPESKADATAVSKATSFNSIGGDMVNRYTRRFGPSFVPLLTEIGPLP